MADDDAVVSALFTADITNLTKSIKQAKSEIDVFANNFETTAANIRKRANDSFNFDPSGLRRFGNESKTILDAFSKNTQIASQSTRELAIDIRSMDRIMQLVSVSAFARQIRDMASAIITTTAKFQDYHSTLEAITGSQEKANKLFSGAMDFSIKTRFDLGDVIGATAQLEAVTKQMGNFKVSTEEARALAGEMALTYGKDFNLAIETVSKVVSGSGRAAQMLKNNFGVTNSELEKFGVTLTKTGGVILRGEGDRKNLFNAIKAITEETTGFKAMELHKDNLSVQIQAVKDKFAILANELGQSVLPALLLFFKALADVVDAFAKLPEPIKIFVTALTLGTGALAVFIQQFSALFILLYTLGSHMNTTTNEMVAQTAAMVNGTKVGQAAAGSLASLSKSQIILASSIQAVNLALAEQKLLLEVQDLPETLARKRSQFIQNASDLTRSDIGKIGRGLAKKELLGDTGLILPGLELGTDTALLNNLGAYRTGMYQPGLSKFPVNDQSIGGINNKYYLGAETSLAASMGQFSRGKAIIGPPTATSAAFLANNIGQSAEDLALDASETAVVANAVKRRGGWGGQFGYEAVSNKALPGINIASNYARYGENLAIGAAGQGYGGLGASFLGAGMVNLGGPKAIAKEATELPQQLTNLQQLFPTVIGSFTKLAEKFTAGTAGLGGLIKGFLTFAITAENIVPVLVGITGAGALLIGGLTLLGFGVKKLADKITEHLTNPTPQGSDNDRKRDAQRFGGSYIEPIEGTDGAIGGTQYRRVKLPKPTDNYFQQNLDLKSLSQDEIDQMRELKIHGKGDEIQLRRKKGLAYIRDIENDMAGQTEEQYLKSGRSGATKETMKNLQTLHENDRAMTTLANRSAPDTTSDKLKEQEKEILTKGKIGEYSGIDQGTHLRELIATQTKLFEVSKQTTQTDAEKEEIQLNLLKTKKQYLTYLEQEANYQIKLGEAGKAWISPAEKTAHLRQELANISDISPDAQKRRDALVIPIKNSEMEEKKYDLDQLKYRQDLKGADEEGVPNSKKLNNINKLINETELTTPGDTPKLQSLRMEQANLQVTVAKDKRSQDIEMAKHFKSTLDQEILAAKDYYFTLHAMGFSDVQIHKIQDKMIANANRKHYEELHNQAVEYQKSVEGLNTAVRGNQSTQLGFRKAQGEDTSAAEQKLTQAEFEARKRDIKRELASIIKLAEFKKANPEANDDKKHNKELQENIIKNARRDAAIKLDAAKDAKYGSDIATGNEHVTYDTEHRKGQIEIDQTLNKTRLDTVTKEFDKTGRVDLEKQMYDLMKQEYLMKSELLKLALTEAMLNTANDPVKRQQLMTKYLADEVALRKEAAQIEKDKRDAVNKTKLDKEIADKAAFYKGGDPTMGTVGTYAELQAKDAAEEDARLKAKAQKDYDAELKRRNAVSDNVADVNYGLQNRPFDATNEQWNKAQTSKWGPPQIDLRKNLGDQTGQVRDGYYSPDGKFMGRPNMPKLTEGKENLREDLFIHLMLDGKEVGKGNLTGSQRAAQTPNTQRTPIGGN